MFSSVLKKIFGTKNERELKRLGPLVEEIKALEDSLSSLSDDRLKNKTEEFRERLQSSETYDDILVEAFAVVREASKRTIGLKHFDVQLIGGIVLHEGTIAEMKTGEGKTLAATLPVYLNALDGRGVHVVTVNDYLAKRDAQWMGPVYHFLGLSVGAIQHDTSFRYNPDYRSEDKRLDFLMECSRKDAYMADITYGTNNEFGFDFLRDNMKYDFTEFAQRELNYAIVDEVDSILIDEARTPLIISGPSEESTDKYYKINRIIPKLKNESDFTIDEKAKNIILTEEGALEVEKLLNVENLFDPVNIEFVHHVLQGLKAHNLFKLDRDYVVKDGEVVIVDEFTGRLMPGRRWSDGLHQAIEAKEGVKIASENQTLASITFQNYFRMYNKLAGMTGTADTEAEEFAKIYNLDVMVIPTNQIMRRQDHPDVIYKTRDAKYRAVINEIEECNKKNQPVLVGTISIETSEFLSKELKKRKIPHSVLNAKFHEKEAEIVTQAGRSGAVTIATNMAGRGTDIVLGGNPIGVAREILKGRSNYSEEEWTGAMEEALKLCSLDREKVLEAGGLFILGTERHEARRIDNQLRGRSGRQGDPGASRFYISLEDDLMRIFGSDKISGLMGRLGMDEDVPIEHKMVSKALENAQKRVEAHNFDIRKHLLEYDDVMNKQRTEIYLYRADILSLENMTDRVIDMSKDVADDILERTCPDNAYPENWDWDTLYDSFYGTFGIQKERLKKGVDQSKSKDSLKDFFYKQVEEAFREKESETGHDIMRYLERNILLQIVDVQWKDHLLAMDHLKEGIGLRGYGQKDPLVEYKREAFDMFEDMTYRISTEFLSRIFKVQVHTDENAFRMRMPSRPLIFNRGEASSQQPLRKGKKTGRNEPCPCGSGKKYKKCCERQ